jgi:hypothetical protein
MRVVRLLVLVAAVAGSLASAGGSRATLRFVSPPVKGTPEIDEVAPEVRAKFVEAHPTFELFDFYPVSEMWGIVRHPETGTILHRQSWFMFGVRDKAAGTCEYWQMRAIQDNTGPDHWGPTWLADADAPSTWDVRTYRLWIDVACPAPGAAGPVATAPAP